VVEVESGSVLEVVVVGSGVVVDGSPGAVVEDEVSGIVVVGLGGRRGGGVGGNRSSMVTGGHMTAASNEAGATPTISKAAVNARTATMAAPNLPGVMGLQANQLPPWWEPSHPE
jgi:hypothetical protein